MNTSACARRDGPFISRLLGSWCLSIHRTLAPIRPSERGVLFSALEAENRYQEAGDQGVFRVRLNSSSAA